MSAVAGVALTALSALVVAEVGLRVAVLPGAEDLPEAAERDPDGAIAGAMQRLATPLAKNGYGQYLKRLLEDKVF